LLLMLAYLLDLSFNAFVYFDLNRSN